MPLPTLITELSTTAASNYPAGTDSPATLDDVQRAHASFIAQLNIGSHVPNATAKATPVDADLIPINDSAASNVLKKLTWANIKATLKTYFDTIYATAGSYIPSNTQSTWASTTAKDNVVGMLGWKNFGNGHVIFDASAGTSPSGGAVNNTTPVSVWAGSYPTLMGWNGTSTYGVRVDTARYAENPIGVGQTWQSVTGSRAFATTYTNSTGKSIQVYIRTTYGAGSNVLTLTVGGVAQVHGGNGSYESYSKIAFIVPPGATYSLVITSGTAALVDWIELR